MTLPHLNDDVDNTVHQLYIYDALCDARKSYLRDEQASNVSMVKMFEEYLQKKLKSKSIDQIIRN